MKKPDHKFTHPETWGGPFYSKYINQWIYQTSRNRDPHWGCRPVTSHKPQGTSGISKKKRFVGKNMVISDQKPTMAYFFISFMYAVVGIFRFFLGWKIPRKVRPLGSMASHLREGAMVAEIRAVHQLRLGSFIPLFIGFFSKIPGGWPWDFWIINSSILVLAFYIWLWYSYSKIYSKNGMNAPLVLFF